MKNLRPCFALFCLFLFCAGTARMHAADTPTAADIEKAMRTAWEKPATAMTGRTTLQLNSVKIGSGAKANDQDVVDGIPAEHWVTVALVDFTVREHGPKIAHAVRRVRTCKVYKDQFDEWAVMLWQARGADQIYDEPAK